MYSLHKYKRIGDTPASGGIDRDELLATRWDLIGIAVPRDDAFIKAADFLNEGQFKVQARLRDRIPDGGTQLDDDSLLCLIERVDGGAKHDADDDQQKEYEGRKYWVFIHD